MGLRLHVYPQAQHHPTSSTPPPQTPIKHAGSRCTPKPPSHKGVGGGGRVGVGGGGAHAMHVHGVHGAICSTKGEACPRPVSKRRVGRGRGHISHLFGRGWGACVAKIKPASPEISLFLLRIDSGSTGEGSTFRGKRLGPPKP